jgi:hypothetical protein
MTKEQSIMTQMLMYTECYNVKNKTPIVDKWLKQIKKNLRKLPIAEYRSLVHESHNAWERAKHEVIPKDSKKTINMSDMLMNLYNKIDERHLYFTDKTFTEVINSFQATSNKPPDSLDYALDSRELANKFLEEIDVDFFNEILERNRTNPGP